MNLGAIKCLNLQNNTAEIIFENQRVIVEVLSDDIINFFIPFYTDKHYSKAIEGDKRKAVDFTAVYSEEDKKVTIKTSKYMVVIGDNFETVIYDANGNIVLKDYTGKRPPKHILTAKEKELIEKEGHDISTYMQEEKPVELLKEMPETACFYGLGDKTGFLNKRGYEYVNWNSDIPQAHNEDYRSLYKSIPFFITKTDTAVFGLFFDNTFRSTFDMCKESSEYFVYEADGGNLDYYFLGGNTIKDVVSNYTYLTGTTPLPKLWTLGYMQCRWGYECEKDIREVALNFRKYRIPCESVQYDIDYMQGYRIFTWDEKTYGKFGSLFKELKSEYGYKPVVIVDPGVKVDYDYFLSKEGHDNNYFAKDPLTGEDYVNEVWPGESNYPEFGRHEVREWWGKHLGEFVSSGIEGIWNDMNEPASFKGELPKDVIFHDEDRQITHAEMHNIYGHYMGKATYEGLKAATGERPFVITRACYAGTQKYSTVWTGDNQSLWSHLQMMVPQLCNLGLSGYAIAGVDIGGFGADCTPELMSRWIEACFMATFFRNHSAKGSKPQEPWRFSNDVIKIYRKYVELHYQFLPYIYDLLKKCEETGIPPMRPVVAEYENDKNTYNLNGEFMYGESMLIAPVLEQGATVKNIYLPEGTWFDFWTKEKLEGGRWILRETPIDICPIYIKAGSIIPMYEVMQYVGEKPYNSLYLLKTEGAASYIHYQDNGKDFAYKDGEYNLYEFNVDEDGNLEKKMLHNGYEVYASITIVCLT